MASRPTDVPRFNWRTQIYAALTAVALAFAIGLCQSDLSLLLYLSALAALLFSFLVLLLYAAIGKKNRRRSLRQVPTLAIFSAVLMAFLFFGRHYPTAIRDFARWTVWSRDYKAQVLAQAPPANGELKHIAWDGWGFVGMDTEVYLVFDPSDALSTAASSRRPGSFSGIPCKVPLVRRLERDWYTVLFYTDQSWGQCN
jgi:hypothetical protein